MFVLTLYLAKVLVAFATLLRSALLYTLNAYFSPLRAILFLRIIIIFNSFSFTFILYSAKVSAVLRFRRDRFLSALW